MHTQLKYKITDLKNYKFFMMILKLFKKIDHIGAIL